jgi:Tfp pilus assembly protein PilN
MIKINLLPVKAAKKKEKVMTQVYVGILVIICALVGLGYVYYMQKSSIGQVQDQIKETNAKIDELKDAEKKFEELQKKKGLLDQQIEAISKLDQGRDWFVRVLDKISESVPHNQLWLSQVKFGGAGRKSSSSAKGGVSLSRSILLKGSAYDRDSVANFMGMLSIIPCDDSLAEEEKAPICQERNKRCRNYNNEKGTWEWDFDGCRRFYKEVCDDSKNCGEDVRACKLDQKNACADSKSKNCEEAKTRCSKVEQDCKNAATSCVKLHEEEYVAYDSVRLSYIKTTAKGKGGTDLVYDFEMTCSATEPPKAE